METDQFRKQLFSCDRLWGSCSSVCICYSSLPDGDPLLLCYHYNLGSPSCPHLCSLIKYRNCLTIPIWCIIQTALIPIQVRTLLEVDYAIEYETYKQLSVSYQFNTFVECSLSGTVLVSLWRLTSLEHNCSLVITCGDHVRLCVFVIHHWLTVTHCYCVTTIISIVPVVPIVFTNKVQKLLNYTDLMHNPNSINSHRSTYIVRGLLCFWVWNL